MCRLLGIKDFDIRAHRTVLDAFLELAEKGKTLAEDPPCHLDGWGIGYYRDGTAFVHKSGRSILDEQKEYYGTLEGIGRSRVLIVHLRKSAWKDTTSARHAHPFSDDSHILAHNGTIRDYKKLLNDIPDGKKTLSDALDTEVFFRYIVSLSPGGMEPGFREAVSRIRRENEYSSLNVVFSDGVKLFAYRDFRKHPEYYTLFRSNAGIISSEPLAPLGDWRSMEREELAIL